MAGERKGWVPLREKTFTYSAYQHHAEMPLKLRSEPAEELLYVCKQPGRLIHYNSSDGYFIDTEDAKTIEQEMAPRVRCPNDDHPMYLAEVRPEREGLACGSARNVTRAARTRSLRTGWEKAESMNSGHGLHWLIVKYGCS